MVSRMRVGDWKRRVSALDGEFVEHLLQQAVVTEEALHRSILVALGVHADWIGFLALPPLFLLLFSGLYLFMLPYVAKWRSGVTQRGYEGT